MMKSYLPARPFAKWPRALLHAFLIAGALLMLYPVLWMLSASFKQAQDLFTDPSILIHNFTLNNYLHGWNELSYPFSTYLLNTLIICACSVIGNIISCSMVAYAFARLRFKFKPLWFAIMLCSVMLPYHAIVVPQYILFKNLGWINTFLPLIVPKFLATDAFFVFLMVQFIRTIPPELDEAATIDGCGSIQMFWRVILPLMQPALITTAIFTFIWTWGDFFTQLIFLNDPKSFTISIALKSFVDNTSSSDFGALFAMSLLSLLPIIGFFLAFQRLITEGINTSGLKG
jgi:pectin-derived oligosaccharide transport system permease protein